uniref:40S ribosomal protein SA n=2 Tax=Anolis carolinensis TaxID=28377 RepID=A0A803THL4_ANOCA
MSRGLDVLQMKEEDVLKFLAAETHLGGTNLDFQMEQYIYKRKSDGIYIINLKRIWEKLLLAVHAIVAIENPADVSVIFSRNTGQHAVLKFAAATGATPIAGRFTPGTFTNQIQAAFHEPCLLVVIDLRADHQPLTEPSYVNIPTIALCNTDCPLCYVDNLFESADPDVKTQSFAEMTCHITHYNIFYNIKTGRSTLDFLRPPLQTGLMLIGCC